MSQNPKASGGTVPVKSSRACVVYEPDSGRISHIHEVVTLEGGEEPTEAQIEAFVMEMLKRMGKPTEKLNILHVPSESVQTHALLSVDPRTKSLISRPKS